MWLEVRSLTRKIRIELDDDGDSAWGLLLVPVGSTDQQVLAWAEECMPAAHLEALRRVIEAEAEA